MASALSTQPAHELPAGHRLGPYVIERLIGRGGMGEVYRAQEASTGRTVAVKVITGEGATNPTMIQRFRHEGKALTLISNPNVVTVYMVGEDNGLPYIAMEYLEGRSLSEIVENFALPGNEAAPLFLQMLNGLEALSSKGIIHRDLKPQNIIYQKDNLIKILDLGIAKVYGSQTMLATSTGMIMGTVQYIAPEVAAGDAATVVSDIWSLGAIFYEVLTGIPLINASNQIHALSKLATLKVSFPPELQAMVDPEMQRIVCKMCDRDPQRRYRAVSEVTADLQAYSQKQPPEGLWLYRCIGTKVANAEALKLELARKGLRPIAVKRVLAEAISESQKIPLQKNLERTVSLESEAIVQIPDDIIQAAMGKLRQVGTAPTPMPKAANERQSHLTSVVTAIFILLAVTGLWWIKKGASRPHSFAESAVTSPTQAVEQQEKSPLKETSAPQPPAPTPTEPAVQATTAPAAAPTPSQAPEDQPSSTGEKENPMGNQSHEQASERSKQSLDHTPPPTRSSVARPSVPNSKSESGFAFRVPENLTPKIEMTLKFAASDDRSPSSTPAIIANPPTLKWNKIPGALGYQIEIAPDDSFTQIAQKYNTQESSYTWKSARPGTLFWRVRGIDKSEKPSNYSEPGLMILKVDPPRLAAPSNAEVPSATPNAKAEILLSWNPVLFITKYNVRIGPKGSSATALIDESVSASQLKIHLPKGDYEASIAALDTHGRAVSDRSPAAKITVSLKETLPSPELLSPPDASTILLTGKMAVPTVFYWQGVERAESYDLEVASDSMFQKTVLAKSNPGNRLVLKDPLPSGRLFWRVRSSNRSGKSTWSQVRTLRVETSR